MSNLQKIFSISIGLLLIILLTVAGIFVYQNRQKSSNDVTISFETSSGTSDSKVSITASFYPIAFFAQEIGKSRVNVVNAVPAGTEPHDFEPSAEQIKKIYDSKVFLFNGSGLDAWAEKIQPELEKKSVKVLNMSQVVDKITLENSEIDPHFWLDPVQAIKQVETIRDALIQADKANFREYNENAGELVSKLQSLDNSYKTKLKNCAKKEIITSHDAFGYLARRYDFKIDSIAGIDPEQEPSAADLAKLVEKAKQQGIKFIFFETLVSPKLSQTLAQEAGAQVLVLNPIEGLSKDDETAGMNYLSIMQDNLTNLSKALECKS